MAASDESLQETIRDLGMQSRPLYLPVQKHTDEVIIVDNNNSEPRIGDAVITSRTDLLIGVRVADCVPLLLFDRKRRVIGAVHAGWRGTAAGILTKTIAAMEAGFLSSPGDLLVAVGPAIRWCCYGVGSEVAEAVEKATGKGEYLRMQGDAYCLDLPAANRQQALSAGVPEGNIWLSPECTSCLPEKYFSYRFSRGGTGRQYGLIGMIP
jgi:hypothetical protein